MKNPLTQKIINFLQTMTLEKLEKFFFALFLLSIPFQTRLTFITPETYQNGTFNEYATFFLYLSDLLFITTLFLFFVKQAKKHRLLTKTNNFSVKEYIFSLFNTYPRLIPIWTLLVTLITWSFVNILWSEYKNLAFYQSFKTLEFALLFLYTYYRLRWFGFNKFAALIFVSGSLESIIGISQYLLQKSLGLKILMESVLSPETPNVAKIVVDGEKIIRAYGTFPHPNIFSGFLILSIFCGFWLLAIKLFHVKQFNSLVSRITTENVKDNTKLMYKIVSRETILANAKWAGAILYIIIILGTLTQLTALILTFSRTAWLAFIFIFFIYVFLVVKTRLFHLPSPPVGGFGETSTCSPKLSSAKQGLMQDKLFHACPSKLPFILHWLTQITQKIMFHVKHYLPKRSGVKQFIQEQVIKIVSRETILITLFLIIPLLIIINIDWKQITNRTNDLQDIYQESVNTRTLYNNIAISIIKDYPITGIGGKNFTLRMQDFTEKPLEWWQFQPVHNIYLLIASELGIVGLGLFLLLIYFVIKISFVNIKHQIISSAFSANWRIRRDKRLPIEASIDIALANPNHTKNIVSRETILANARERETILLQLGIISILIGFLFIGLFDHYFWTLQQGQLAFWIILGVIASFKR